MHIGEPNSIIIQWIWLPIFCDCHHFRGGDWPPAYIFGVEKLRILRYNKTTMKIIISPAKKMNMDTDTLACNGLPVFLERTEEIKNWIQGLSYEQQKKLWSCNDKIAELNRERFKTMALERFLTPALLSYEGIAYQYMAPYVFDDAQWAYVQEHLRILSGFYGILKPLDGVVPYRLEMQARAAVGGHKNLYDFWGDSIYKQLIEDDRNQLIINLASAEYSKCIEKYLTGDARYVTVVFGEWKDGKAIQKGTMAKMARGEMVRYMAGVQAEDLEPLKRFDRLGYAWSEALSDEKTLVFIKDSEIKQTVE